MYGTSKDCKGHIIKSAIRVGRIDAFYDAVKWKQEQDKKMHNDKEVNELLDKLLENNMCSHAGDELIKQFKNKT